MISAIFKIMIGICALFGVTAAAAAEPLTRELAMARALEHNAELQALRQELGIAEAQAARAGLRPDLVFEVGMETGEWTNARGENRYRAGLSREFAAPGKQGLRRSAGSKELEVARAQVEDTERLLKRALKDKLHGYRHAQEQEALARRSAELDRELLEVAQQRFAAGDVAELEVNIARVEALQAEERWKALALDTAGWLQELGQLMGWPASSQPELELVLATGNYAAEPEALRRRALQLRPDLRALQLQVESSRIGVDLAKLEKWPNPTAGLSYSQEQSREQFGGEVADATDHLLGLQLSVSIPAGGRPQAALREATARRSGAEHRLKGLQDAVVREVDGAVARLEGAATSVDRYRVGVLPALEANLQTLREAYRLGEAGLWNVLEGRRRYEETSADYLRRLYDWNLAMTALEAAVGEELTVDEGEKQ
ncbi:MAG: TolC family protein [Trichloromonadaceae bacterium]